MNILNIPEYAHNYEFIVCREIDNDLWFWGAFDNGFKADEVAREIGGIIVHDVRIQGKRKEK